MPNDVDRLLEIVDLLDQGKPIPPELAEFLADGLERILSGSKPWDINTNGAPPVRRREWLTFASWFASNCDPDFNALSKTKVTGRYAQVAQFLSTSESTVKRRCELFESCLDRDDDWFLVVHGERYARLKGWEWKYGTPIEEMAKHFQAYLEELKTP